MQRKKWLCWLALAKTPHSYHNSQGKHGRGKTLPNLPTLQVPARSSFVDSRFVQNAGTPAPRPVAYAARQKLEDASKSHGKDSILTTPFNRQLLSLSISTLHPTH